MDFTIKTRDGFLELVLTGSTEVSVFAESFDALTSRADWNPGARILVNETGMSAESTTIQEVREIALVCVQRKERFGSARGAILVSRELEYGLNRMWDVFVEDKWDVETALFRSRDEAVAWLMG
jgi:hypothetical protein